MSTEEETGEGRGESKTRGTVKAGSVIGVDASPCASSRHVRWLSTTPSSQAQPREDAGRDAPKLLSVDELAVKGRASEEGDVVRGASGTKGGVLDFWQRDEIEVHHSLEPAPLDSTLQGLRYAAALKAFRFRLRGVRGKEEVTFTSIDRPEEGGNTTRKNELFECESVGEHARMLE